MVEKSVLGRGMAQRGITITGAGLLLAALYAAACSSAGGGGNGGPGGPNNGTAASQAVGGIGANTGGASGVSGNNPAGGINGTSGFPGMAPACVPQGESAPTLPASFQGKCSVCHSAFGASANPKVPNL